MTLTELINSFGDKKTDPFLSEPRLPPPFAPLGGASPSSGPDALTEESPPWDRALETLPIDSVFFDGSNVPARDAEPERTPAPSLPPHPSAVSREIPSAEIPSLPPHSPAVSAEIPSRPEPGVQFSTVIGREDLGDLNRRLGKGWRIIHAVPLGSGEVMIFLEFGNPAPGGRASREVSPLPSRRAYDMDASSPEAASASAPAWVAMPATDPFDSLDEDV